MRIMMPRLTFASLALTLLSGVSRAEEKQAGLPQLDPHTYASQLFWLAVMFIIVFVFMQTVGVPRVAAIIEERRRRIGNDLDEAERVRKDADETLKAYQASLADAHGKARQLIAATHEKNAAILSERTAAAAKEFETRVS